MTVGAGRDAVLVLTLAQREQRRSAALKHGAESPAQIGHVARTQKRRLMRQNGLRICDLDGVGLALVDNWARAQAKVELLDRHFASVGLLNDDGEPRGATKIYFVALNSARLAAVRLAEHLKARPAGPDPLAALEATGRRIIAERDLPAQGSR